MDDSKPRPLKESTIKFTVKNGKTSLSFDFTTFVATTRLDYNNGNYKALPQTEVMKAEILKLSLHNERNVEESASVLVNKTPLFKTEFPKAWRILMTFVIQVLSGNKSSTDQLNLSQHMIVYTLLRRAKIDIGEIIFNDLVSRLTEKPRKKYVAYPRFLSCVLESLLVSDYNHNAALGSTPSVLSKLNFHRNSSEVPPIELTEHMLSVVSHQASVSPTLSLEREYHLRKQRARSRPRPNNPEIVQTHLDQKERVIGGTDTSKSVSTDQPTDVKDSEGNTQPADMGSPTINPNEGIRTSQPLPEGTNHDLKDLEGNKQLANTGFPSTPKDGIRRSQLLPKGKATDAKDPKRNKQLTGIGLPFTHPDEGNRKSHLLPEGTTTDFKDSGRNIQLTDTGLPSTMVSNPDHNKGKTSSEVKPDIQAPIQSFQDFEILMEDSEDDLKELSDEENFEAGDEMEDAFPLNTKEASQPPPSTEKVIPSEEQPQHEESSPTLDDSLPESSKSVKKTTKKSEESEPSHDPSDSKSSSAFGSFKAYDNYMPVTERVMARNLQGFLKLKFLGFMMSPSELLRTLMLLLGIMKRFCLNSNLSKWKVLEATDAYVKNSAKLTELNLHLKEVINTYKLNSTNMSDLVELISEANIMADTAEIKAMMTEFFCAFKGQPFSTPQGVCQCQHLQSPMLMQHFVPNPERKAEEEKEIPSHTEGEQEDMVIEEPKEEKVTEEKPKKLRKSRSEDVSILEVEAT
ncbi:hypothetical protein Tco_0441552 [Tanacetum coccineum]